jgi:hypothetical protein
MADQKISELTAFTDLIDADVVPVVDSTAGASKKTTWANIKSVLKTYFDSIYVTSGGALGTPTSGTVTNLTGTASININGTVGATTPSSGTFTDIILPAGSGIKITLPTTDAQCTGNYTSSFNSGYSASAGDLVFYGSGGKWLEVDADAVATCKGLLGIAMEAKNDGEAMKVALPGSMVHFDAWTWTTGDTLYAGETLGAMQNSIPTGADAIIRVVGFAIDTDTLFFNPSSDQQSTVA